MRSRDLVRCERTGVGTKGRSTARNNGIRRIRSACGEGNVACVPDVAFKDLCIDVTAGAGRPDAVVKFWSKALDQEAVADPDGSFHLAPPPGGPKSRSVWINPVAEPISAKSRVHIDIRVADGDPAPLFDVGGTIERAEGRRHRMDDRR